MAIQKLAPKIFDKVWGSPLTQPWLANPEGRKVGEIWFSAPDVLPVLVKFLFTSDCLSVQVHPDDAYAQARGQIRGKTEMWHILRAEPDASIALGLRDPVTKERLRAGALSGEIIDLLQWIPAYAGDTFFVPAGTIHAIGGGLAICEVQQYSDATYRLFDHQRKPPRELHLEDSLAVARLEPTGDCGHATLLEDGRELLAECPYFRAERLALRGSWECPTSPRPAIYVATSGEGEIAAQPFRAGDTWLVPAGTPPFVIDGASVTFIIASGPA